jgi:SAM-dependent methyltransferase
MTADDEPTTWGLGDYAEMATRLGPAALAAIELAGVRPGEHVLDIATGTGNAAVIAAARGAEVIGTDLEPVLLRLAEGRTTDVTWIAADAVASPVPDGWADVVVSVFGVMYAADHDAAARELARCVAPRGRVVLASWMPGSFMAAMGGALGPYLPAPPVGSGPPSRWGDLDLLEGLFVPHGLRLVESAQRCVTLGFAGIAEGVDFLVRTAGHVVAERDRLVADGRWKDLLGDLEWLVVARSRPSGDGLEIDLKYLLALALAGD